MNGSSLGAQIAEAFAEMGRSAAAAAPRVVLGLVLVLLAFVVAKAVEIALRVVFRRLRFDQLLARVGIDRTLGRIGVREPLNLVVPRLAYYLTLFLFVRTAADGLGLRAVSEAMGTFLGYLPNLGAAVLILVLGGVFAQFAGRAVAEAGRNSGIDFADSLAGVVSGLIMFVLGVMALGQLRIDTEIVRIVTICLLCGLSLGFGLSFGLGSRDVTRSIIAGFYARKIFQTGDTLEIRGRRGVLRSITPTQTILEHEGGLLAVGNGVFLDELVSSSEAPAPAAASDGD